MCGIAGAVLTTAAAVGGHEVVSRMLQRIEHRGPDGTGIFQSADRRFTIGNTRLAIRDLSPAGALPLTIDSNRLAIAYNGEVYNASALRRELETHGHVFKSGNDAEVVLRSYAQWGSEAPARLRGMFAFLILDARAEPTLFIARDPLGIKPLYIARFAEGLLFASELKALRGSDLAAKEIDATSLQAYLLLGSVPAPRTIYRDVSALEPATLARVDTAARLQQQKYWQLPTDARPIGDVIGATKDALRDAVESHLVSDVPVGAFLSGGLDSSTVVALMAAVAGTTIRTCSLAFEDRTLDESVYAREVARTFGTDHYERVLTESEALAGLDRAFAAMDQPSIDGLNTYFVTKVARDAELKVVLSGLGGDELFGGYESTFVGVPRLLRIQQLSRMVPGGSALARASIDSLGKQQRWRKVAEALQRGPAPAAAYMAFRGLFTNAEVNALIPADSSIERYDAQSAVADTAGAIGSPASRNGIKAWVSRAELRNYTVNQLLRDTDVMSMAHSIEVRVPLLDTLLVEHVLRIPPARRFAGSGSKPLLRQIAQQLLPEVVLNRRSRMGFVLPLDRWLREGQLSDTMTWDSPVFQLFDRASLAQLRDDFRAGRAHWSRVWALCALEGWQANAA